MTRPESISVGLSLLALLPGRALAGAFEPGDGRYRLQTRFLESEKHCLEGNERGPKATLDGAALEGECEDVSGQLRKFVPVRRGVARTPVAVCARAPGLARTFTARYPR